MIPRTLFTPEHETFRDSVRRFMQEEVVPHDERWQEQGYVDKEVWKKAGANGFLCCSVPEEYGGAGADRLYSVVLMEEQARANNSSLGWGLHSEIVAPYLLRYGSEALKKKYLPKMASGEMIGAIAMSEPGAGSDLQAVKTSAIKKGDKYVVNGSKTFITNGWNCDLVIVVAKTDPTKGAKGTSLVIVDTSMKGFTKGRRLKKMGLKGQDTAELFFDEVRVPVANRVGGEGDGFRIAMMGLDGGRLNIGACSLGGAQRCLDEAVKYTKERKQFGHAIADFQNTQFTLADMETELQAARWLLAHTAALDEQGREIRPIAPSVDRPQRADSESDQAVPRVFIGVSLGRDFDRLNAHSQPRPVAQAASGAGTDGEMEVISTTIAASGDEQSG